MNNSNRIQVYYQNQFQGIWSNTTTAKKEFKAKGVKWGEECRIRYVWYSDSILNRKFTGN